MFSILTRGCRQTEPIDIPQAEVVQVMLSPFERCLESSKYKDRLILQSTIETLSRLGNDDRFQEIDKIMKMTNNELYNEYFHVSMDTLPQHRKDSCLFRLLLKEEYHYLKNNKVIKNYYNS